MGRAVEFADVVTAVERFGPLATLVTVGDDGSPHVGTVLVTVVDGRLAAGVGSGTCRNVTARPAVSLAWLRPDADYQLIVDGTARVEGAAGEDGLQPITVTVEKGILHRLAGRSEAGPTCLPLPGTVDTALPGPADTADGTAPDGGGIVVGPPC